jgi:hypothetical protein
MMRTEIKKPQIPSSCDSIASNVQIVNPVKVEPYCVSNGCRYDFLYNEHWVGKFNPCTKGNVGAIIRHNQPQEPSLYEFSHDTNSECYPRTLRPEKAGKKELGRRAEALFIQHWLPVHSAVNGPDKHGHGFYLSQIATSVKILPPCLDSAHDKPVGEIQNDSELNRDDSDKTLMTARPHISSLTARSNSERFNHLLRTHWCCTHPGVIAGIFNASVTDGKGCGKTRPKLLSQPTGSPRQEDQNKLLIQEAELSECLKDQDQPKIISKVENVADSGNELHEFVSLHLSRFCDQNYFAPFLQYG